MTAWQDVSKLKANGWKSMFFNRLRGRAARLALDRPRLWGRVGRAAMLARQHRGAFGGNYGRLRALFRMLRAWSKGLYRPSRWTIISAIAVVLYIISPLDFIPDFIPVVGWLDDASFFVWVLGKIGRELDRFVEWERQGQTADHPQARLLPAP